MYVVGEADGFSIDEHGKPLLTPVVDGGHFHNPPGAPHAFLPRVGTPKPDNWEIAFIAITPRNLMEDTHRVSDEASYVTGVDIPVDGGTILLNRGVPTATGAAPPTPGDAYRK